MAKDLINQTPTSAFRKSFDIQIIVDRTPFCPGIQIEVRHNSIVEVSIENRGDKALYAHMYNLDSCWRVKGMLYATYETIPPRKDPRNGDLPFLGRFSKKIRMTVSPMMKEHGSCEDIIKIFVTSQPTSFDLLELPNVDGLVDTIAGERGGYPNSQVPEDWVALSFPIRTLL
jgi:hypothetical protein